MFTLSSSGLVPPLAGTKSSVPAGPRGPIGPGRRSQTAAPRHTPPRGPTSKSRAEAALEKSGDGSQSAPERSARPLHRTHRTSQGPAGHVLPVGTHRTRERVRRLRQTFRTAGLALQAEPFFYFNFFTGTWRGVSAPACFSGRLQEF